MTAQQAKTITHINDALATERHIAAQAARETAELDVLSVKIAIEVKIAEGRMDEARAIAKAWKAGQL